MEGPKRILPRTESWSGRDSSWSAGSGDPAGGCANLCFVLLKTRPNRGITRAEVAWKNPRTVPGPLVVLREHKLLGLSRSRWPRVVPRYIHVRLALRPYQVVSASVRRMGEWLPKTPGLSQVEVVTQAKGGGWRGHPGREGRRCRSPLVPPWAHGWSLMGLT